MNPVVVVHLVAALVAIAVSLPLVRRKVKMNHWYGVRIPAAFESEEAWFEINQYGGQLLVVWGLVISATALAGAFLGRQYWLAYDWAALVIIAGSLVVVVAKIYRYGARRKGRLAVPAREQSHH